MRWIDDRRVATKLATNIVLMVTGLACLFGVSLYVLQRQMIADREGKARIAVEMIASYAANLNQLEQAGKLSHADMLKKLVEVTNAQRYDTDNYVNIYTADGIQIAAPVEPERVGTNRFGHKDANGVPIVETGRDIAKAQGSGYYYYSTNRPNSTTQEPKLTFAQALTPGGGLFAISGIYVNDVREAMWRLAAMSGGIALALVALIGSLSWLIQRSIGGGLRRLGQSMNRLAEGDLHAEVAERRRRDEIGAMAAAVQVFKDGMISKAELEQRSADQRRDAETQRQQLDAARAEAVRHQTEAVSSLAAGLSKLSDGDLTAEIATPFAPNYEPVRHDFNRTAIQLRAAMGEVSANTSALQSGALELTQAADDLARRTEQQAASLEETAAALDEVTVMVQNTAAGAKQALQAVSTTKDNAQQSGETVAKAVTAMGAIEASSRQIGQIIGVIDEIAFQTNLLALNAGVEAARAGDAGRGFAVVASEVRGLAQRSANAAKEIKSLISTSTQQVESGVKLVSETGRALSQIVDQVGGIDRAVGRIAASAAEQAAGLAQVNTAINQMDQVTQQNAAMVEQSTAASHALAQEAQTLLGLTRKFRTSREEGHSSDRRSAAA